MPYVLEFYANFVSKFLIHLAVCLTTGPKPLPNRALHTVRSRASSFKCEYPLLSLRPSSRFLRFLPRLPVTSIPPFIFPSITRCRRQFLRKMWQIQLDFRATNRKVAGSIPAGVSGFFIDVKFFRPHYGPGVDSASNRNEYQENFLGVKAAGV